MMFGEHPGQLCSPWAPWSCTWRGGSGPASLPTASAASASGLLPAAQPRVFLQKGAMDPSRFRSEAPYGAQGFHTHSASPGLCPVTGGWMWASPGASQGWAVCADSASCLSRVTVPVAVSLAAVRLSSSSGHRFQDRGPRQSGQGMQHSQCGASPKPQ